MSSTPFRNLVGGPPPRYRTPSPPFDAVEPLSPILSSSPYPPNSNHWTEYNKNPFHFPYYEGKKRPRTEHHSKFRKPSHDDNVRLDVARTRESHNTWTRKTSATGANNAGYSPENVGHSGGRRSGHTRSGSTIDTLATIALATSPTFAPEPPESPRHNVSASTRYEVENPWTSIERPSKRARSEKLASPIFHRTESRPATSYQLSSETMRDEAELLLNLARPNRFTPSQTSPISQVPQQNGFHRAPSSDQRSPNQTPELTTLNHGLGLGIDDNFAAPDHGVEARLGTSVGSNSPAMADPAASSPHLISEMKAEPASPVDTNGKDTDSKEANTGTIEGLQYEARQEGAAISEAEGPKVDGPPNRPDSEAPPPKREQPSSQATCAKCNLTQTTIGGEDQNSATSWISCDGCKSWFHYRCAGFNDEREVRTVDKYICDQCESVHGSTTFVRTSSRARTAIDYAGLNQGVVKSSTENPEHHYIKPIKEGKIKFQPENFPRMRPELVTAEYFERGSGMKEPIVIPAWMNPRPGVLSETKTPEAGSAISTHNTVEETENAAEEYIYEAVQDCDQDRLDMVIPQDLTVRTVAELYGPDERVEVIDVKSQQGEDKRWNMRRWADYYESTGAKVVRNVISLEVSQSKLGRMIRRPKIVRDLDLQDSVWPVELQAAGDYPKVQFYCLMSVADCYTDFHIDFGGSSVYYHILKGKKTFFFIPPHEKHLKKYEEWCMSPNQDTTFLGDVTKECYRVDLSAGDTMLIPAGWIHSVWTPENSLVIGGNFLTRMHYEMQIKIAKIEKDTKVARKFRYPYFQKILWYTAIRYLEEDPVPQVVLENFYLSEKYRFYRPRPIYYEFGEDINMAEPGSEWFNARTYSQAELDGLPGLSTYLLRTAMIAGGLNSDAITVETRHAVKRSIPKGYGEPIDLIKTFGLWCAWKRGNEEAPLWTRPESMPAIAKADATGKKVTKPEVLRTPPERVSTRVQSQVQASSAAVNDAVTSVTAVPLDLHKRRASETALQEDDDPKPKSTPKTSGLGPKRIACDACRRRRIRCRHKEEQDEISLSGSDTAKPKVATAYPLSGVEGQNSSQSMLSAFLDGTASPEEVKSLPSTSGDNIISLGQQLSQASQDLPNDNLSSSSIVGNFNEIISQGSSSKKGRSKACDECRKSKRRCIHDELGRIDPVKAQEPSKPRAAGSAKRPARPSDETLRTPLTKRPRNGEEGDQDASDSILVGQAQSALAEFASQPSPPLEMQSLGKDTVHDLEGLIDPALTQSSSNARSSDLTPSFGAGLAGIAAAAVADGTQGAAPGDGEGEEDTYRPQSPSARAHGAIRPTVDVQASDPPANLSPVHWIEHSATNAIHTMPTSSATPAASLASPPNSLLNDADFSPTAADGEVRNTIEGGETSDQSNPLHTPKSTSRHSSRQPKQVDRFVPDASVTSKAPSSNARRASTVSVHLNNGRSDSRQASTQASPNMKPTDGKAPSSITPSHTSPTLANGKSATPDSARLKRERSSFGEIDADPDTVKLIRELQEQEWGLRRRAGRVQ